MSIVSCSATGIARPAACTNPSVDGPSSTAGRRVKWATIVRGRLGTSSPRARSSRGRLRTTLSWLVVMLARPSSRAPRLTDSAGRTKASNSWATPGRGSKARGPWATTGTITLSARRIASARVPSSGREASKKIANAITRGPAAPRASSACA
jgi:hypothetical protein